MTSNGVPPVATPEVSLASKNAETLSCPECGTEFKRRGGKTFCKPACRNVAYRRDSPAYARYSQGLQNQRCNRKGALLREINASKALGFDGKHSGPIRDGFSRWTDYSLKNFSKELG